MRHGQLRAFHNVALHGGFSRAAEALNMTQPSVSDHVKRLEQFYDALLFHREARQVRLTDAGEALFRLTSEYFEVEERIVARLDQSRAAVSGALRIVADSALHITDMVGEFRKANPKVFVSIHTGNTESVLRRLRNYEAEVGVVGNIVEASDLDLVELGRTPIVVIAKKGYLPDRVEMLHLSDLRKYPLVFRELGSRTRSNLEQMSEQLGVPLTPAIEVEGREAMRAIVASGGGIGFVSEAEFGYDRRLMRIPVEGVDLGMSESLVTLKTRRDVPIVRAFLKCVSKRC